MINKINFSKTASSSESPRSPKWRKVSVYVLSFHIVSSTEKVFVKLRKYKLYKIHNFSNKHVLFKNLQVNSISYGKKHMYNFKG